MAVNWTQEQAEKVTEALKAHPIASGDCERCAIAVVKVGKELDPSAHCLSVRPKGRERFVVPKAKLNGVRWFYHFTAAIDSHCVDVLTLTPGTASERYLDTHWHYADALLISVEEPSND